MVSKRLPSTVMKCKGFCSEEGLKPELNIFTYSGLFSVKAEVLKITALTRPMFLEDPGLKDLQKGLS